MATACPLPGGDSDDDLNDDSRERASARTAGRSTTPGLSGHGAHGEPDLAAPAGTQQAEDVDMQDGQDVLQGDVAMEDRQDVRQSYDGKKDNLDYEIDY